MKGYSLLTRRAKIYYAVRDKRLIGSLITLGLLGVGYFFHENKKAAEHVKYRFNRAVSNISSKEELTLENLLEEFIESARFRNLSKIIYENNKRYEEELKRKKDYEEK